MTIKARIAKLQEKMKPIKEGIERKKEELKQREESFHILNQVMKEHYPEHEWNGLSSKEKKRIYFTKRIGKYKTNCLLPVFIPFNKNESELLRTVLRLVADVFRNELELRRKARFDTGIKT